MAAPKRSGLGRGLDALFADAVPVSDSAEKKQEKPAAAADAVQYINIHDIMPNANQPRKTFSEEKIDELSKSIKEHGIIQPIVVRKKGESYEIVAGERRWRAARKAELTQVPCLIRELTDEQNMLIAIIENMQREDLNPVEEAEGLNQMITTFGMTQEQVSKSVGKSRPYIANSLRLLKLPEYIKNEMAEGRLSAAHGRTLITVESEDVRKALCDKIIREGLSVRETERLVSAQGKGKKKRPAAKVKNPDVARVESELKDALGTRVSIVQNGKKGKIEIEYFSREELDRLIELLKKLG
ncbi:MAG: ParB/RepB/Spo0J family partition protein [Anaerovoracaceae bacterium]|nr:ParB/RepB/Spo0J family partition protein [Bacillota bacterium]MDY5770545.1 ParB/RepB/Spo0J family partition protein [Anaerovoracaceae bacterium]